MLGIWLLVRYSVLPDFTREADTRQTYFHIALEGEKDFLVFLGTVNAMEKSTAGSEADSSTAEVRIRGGPSSVPKRESRGQLWNGGTTISWPAWHEKVMLGEFYGRPLFLGCGRWWERPVVRATHNRVETCDLSHRWNRMVNTLSFVLMVRCHTHPVLVNVSQVLCAVQGLVTESGCPYQPDHFKMV